MADQCLHQIKRCCAFLVNMSFDLIRAFANNFMSEVISPYFICHPLYDHRRCCGGGAWGDVLGYENSVIYMACVMLHDCVCFYIVWRYFHPLHF